MLRECPVAAVGTAGSAAASITTSPAAGAAEFDKRIIMEHAILGKGFAPAGPGEIMKVLHVLNVATLVFVTAASLPPSSGRTG
jgi:hypothetical protein